MLHSEINCGTMFAWFGWGWLIPNDHSFSFKKMMVSRKAGFGVRICPSFNPHIFVSRIVLTPGFCGCRTGRPRTEGFQWLRSVLVLVGLRFDVVFANPLMDWIKSHSVFGCILHILPLDSICLFNHAVSPCFPFFNQRSLGSRVP